MVITLDDNSTRQGTVCNVDPVNVSVSLRKVRRRAAASHAGPIAAAFSNSTFETSIVAFAAETAAMLLLLIGFFFGASENENSPFLFLPSHPRFARLCSVHRATQVRFLRCVCWHGGGVRRRTKRSALNLRKGRRHTRHPQQRFLEPKRSFQREISPRHRFSLFQGKVFFTSRNVV